MAGRWLLAFLLAGAACRAGPALEADAGEPGFVLVDQLHVGGAFYTEGSHSFVLVEDAEGRTVLEHTFTDGRLTRPLLRERLEPGAYRLESYQRACVGSCAALDPPSSRCSGNFVVASGATVSVLVRLRPPDPCAMAFGERVDDELAYEQAREACAAAASAPHGPSWILEPPGRSLEPGRVARRYAREVFPDFERFVLQAAERGCREGLRAPARPAG